MILAFWPIEVGVEYIVALLAVGRGVGTLLEVIFGLGCVEFTEAKLPSRGPFPIWIFATLVASVLAALWYQGVFQISPIALQKKIKIFSSHTKSLETEITINDSTYFTVQPLLNILG